VCSKADTVVTLLVAVSDGASGRHHEPLEQRVERYSMLSEIGLIPFSAFFPLSSAPM
jgi:hypothetical protein